MKQFSFSFLLLIFFLIGALQVCYPQDKSTIKGVVTYFFNKYQGDKPDLGAQVWLIDSTKANGYNQPLSDTFYYGYFYRNLYAGARKVPNDVKEQIKKWGVEKDEDFKSIDERAMRNFLNIENNPNLLRTTVDATGRYSFEVQPGTYYIIIKSKGRNGLSITEINGKFYSDKIILISGQTKDHSYNFSIN